MHTLALNRSPRGDAHARRAAEPRRSRRSLARFVSLTLACSDPLQCRLLRASAVQVTQRGLQHSQQLNCHIARCAQ
jgi:hypothetical protein